MVLVGRDALTGRRRRDDGVTLVEVTIAMALSVVVGTIFLGGMSQLRSSGAANESLAAAQEQVHLVFLRMERQVRYATGISAPAYVNGSWYVEYATSEAGVDRCTQVRMPDAGTVQTRVQPTGQAIGAWRTLAAGLTGSRGFTRTAASTSGLRHQQLTVSFAVSPGTRPGQLSRAEEFTFTALNTSAGTPDVVCAGMGRP
jgi:Tfp pilus assembly protein PilW